MTKALNKMLEFSVGLLPDPQAGLPMGHLTCTCRVKAVTTPKGVEFTPRVDRILIEFPTRDGAVARTRSFDGDKILIDYNERGDLLAIEFLGFGPPKKFPEFIRYFREEGAPPEVPLGASTAMTYQEVLIAGMATAIRAVVDMNVGKPEPHDLTNRIQRYLEEPGHREQHWRTQPFAVA